MIAIMDDPEWLAKETRLQKLLMRHRNINLALEKWQLDTFGPNRRSGFFDKEKVEES